MVTVSCCASAPEAVKTASREVRISLFIFYVLYFACDFRLGSNSGNKKTGKPRSAPFTFWIRQLSPGLLADLESEPHAPLRISVHDIFQPSRTPSRCPGRDRLSFEGGFCDRVQSLPELFNCVKFEISEILNSHPFWQWTHSCVGAAIRRDRANA